MGQMIPAASGDNAQTKGPEFAGLFKMADSSSGKIKVSHAKSGKDEEEVNDVVPFLQFLNQQIVQANKDSETINENNITLEQATSLLQGDAAAFRKTQQSLINEAMSLETKAADDKQNNQQKEISIDDLLNEMDKLSNVINSGNPELQTASLEQGQGKTISDESVIIDKLMPSLDNESKEKPVNSKNEAKAINDKNDSLNQAGMFNSETKNNDFLQSDKLSEQSQTKMTKIESENAIEEMSSALKTDNINVQSNQVNEPVNIERESNIQSKEKEPVLTGFENTIQRQKTTIENPDSLSVNLSEKINLSPAELKTDNKITKDEDINKGAQSIESEKAGKEETVINNNFRLTESEVKETNTGRESIHSGKHQHSDIAGSNSGNKFQSEKMQVISGEASGNAKAEQKGKTISSEKVEDFTLGSASISGSNQKPVEKISDAGADKIVNQISGQIKEAAADGGGRVKISLDPPSLGKLEMDVTVRNGKVEVVLVAENKDVQQALNAHIDKLKGGLQSQGLTIDRCDVFMQDKRDEYQQNFNQQSLYQDSGSQQKDNGRQEQSAEKAPTGTVLSMKPENVSGGTISTDNISLFA